MGAKEFFKNLIGVDDDLGEYEISDREIEEEKRRMMEESGYKAADEPAPYSTGIGNAYTEVVPPMSFSKPKNTIDNKESMNLSSPFKMVLIEPKNLDECRKLVDNLRDNKPVIVNLEKVETEMARKMFHFMGGASYALKGTVQRVTQNIFIFAPNNVNIKADIDRATEAGKAESSSPWK